MSKKSGTKSYSAELCEKAVRLVTERGYRSYENANLNGQTSSDDSLKLLSMPSGSGE